MKAHHLKRICVLLALFAQSSQANPLNPTVVSGQASFATNGNVLTVTNTPGAIINWQGFSIGANEVTRFAQQSAASAVLNRVISTNPSGILGSLQSNGRVFLINPGGIVFGAGATVDVAGLVASTLNLSNADFLAGNMHFTQVPGAANVSNAGNITAHGDGLAGGQVFLIAPNVANTGVITAPNGEILLAAGYSVDLVSTSNPALRVSITAPAGDATNVGQLIASSGSLGLFGTLVRNSGSVSADSATLQGGRIVFKASSRVDAGGTVSAQGAGGGNIAILADMQTGTVNLTGRLDASDVSLTSHGGYIETSAAHVQIYDTAAVSTFSRNGTSGTWLIDPAVFSIAASGGNITGATVSTSLGSGNVVIANPAGSVDILVNDTVSWNSVYSLTLNASRNVNVSQVISNAGTGSVNLRADVNGWCVAGAANCGSVSFAGAGHVSATTNIYYNPTGSNAVALANGVGPSYAAPTDYTSNVTGTLNAYMLVNDVNQLQSMNTNLAGKYALGTNIDATATSTWNAGAGFVPVGNAIGAPFTGQLDGLSHTVSSLYFYTTTVDYVGLFGYAGAGAVIRDVGLVGVNVTGQHYVGGLAGWNAGGSVSNAYVTGNLNGSSYVGGLIGYNNTGAISNSYASSNVVGSNYVGGLAGINDYGTISNAYATGNVSGIGYIGGLMGASTSGVVSNSYATGSVTGASNVGGLAGYNFYGMVGNSYATGSVSGDTNAGGLVGNSSGGAVSNSYWNLTSSGQANSSGGTGLTPAQMKTLSSFTGWSIAGTGGAGMTWRIYEGQTYPLLTSFLTSLTVTANDSAKTYDGIAYAGGNGVSYSQVVGEVGLYGALVYGGTSQGAVNAGRYALAPGGQYSDQQNYDVSYVNGALTVNPAALTVAANFLSKRAGGIDPVFTYTVTGLQSADTATNTLNGLLARVSGETVGAYPVNQGSLDLSTGNYTLDYVSGTFSILPSVTGTIDVPGNFFNSILLPGTNGASERRGNNRPPASVLVLNEGTYQTGDDGQPLPVCR